MKNLKSKLYCLMFATLLIIGCTDSNIDVEMNRRMSESLDDNRTEMQLKPMPDIEIPESYK